MQKPTQPGQGTLLGQVGLCVGTRVQRRLASIVELSAQHREVGVTPELLVAPAAGADR